MYITGSPIEYIDKMAFTGNLLLVVLKLTNTGLTTMPPLDLVKRRLLVLSLDCNQISIVPSAYFKGFDHLKEVSLQQNIIQTFPDMTPLSDTLVSIKLFDNQIQSITRSFYMTTFNQMERLHLGSNHISSFDYESFAAWPKLIQVGLGSNKITALPYVAQEHRNCTDDHLLFCFMYLADNPIRCDGRLASLIKQNVSLDDKCIKWSCRMTIRSIIRCASPPHLCGRMIGELSKPSFS